MKTLKVSFIYLITVFTFVLISGCSKEENPAGGNGGGGTPAINALIGTWNATSSTNPNIQGGSNLISAENTMKFTFTATNFTFNGTGQFCDPGESCSQTGAVTATATSFTVTWSDGDTETNNYTLSGNTLTTSYTDESGTYTFICQKQ